VTTPRAGGERLHGDHDPFRLCYRDPKERFKVMEAPSMIHARLRAALTARDGSMIFTEGHELGTEMAPLVRRAVSFDTILAVDIGGTNIRAGIVHLNTKRAADFSKAKVGKFELWRHGDEKLSQDDAVQELVHMVRRLLRTAGKEDLNLAPFIGIGCPGRIEPDGSIDRGAQNLPGNWESSRINLPASLIEAIPTIGEFEKPLSCTTIRWCRAAARCGLCRM
jgi:hypothetical protein